MKQFKIFTCLLAATVLFFSCDDDDDYVGLTFDKNEVEVIVGQSETVEVKNAVGAIKITSSDEEVATAAEKSTMDAAASVRKIEINGVKVSENPVLITVTDENGNVGTVKVTVVADPLDVETTRFVWNETSKVEGTDNGTYTFTQDAETGVATFAWVSEDEKNTITLSFVDEAKDLQVGEMKDAKLVIDGEETAVENLEIVKSVVLEGNELPTVWVSFTAGEKNGICVATLSVVEEPEVEA